MNKYQELFSIAQRAHNLDCELKCAIDELIAQANDNNIGLIIDICEHIIYEGLDEQYILWTNQAELAMFSRLDIYLEDKSA